VHGAIALVITCCSPVLNCGLTSRNYSMVLVVYLLLLRASECYLIPVKFLSNLLVGWYKIVKYCFRIRDPNRPRFTGFGSAVYPCVPNSVQ
jgi:hypothetical protein